MAELFAVITITLLAVISPGPDFAMVTRNSLLLSRRAGVLTAVGIGAGVLVHLTYTVWGVGLLVRQSPWIFGALKLAGAVYLIYLGIRMLRTTTDRRPHDDVPDVPAALSDRAALRTGFFTNALNPKTSVFIVSLFMQVVHGDTPLAIQLAYGAWISVAHVAWFAMVARFFSTDAIRGRLLALRKWIDRLFGGVLVVFGVMLAAFDGR